MTDGPDVLISRAFPPEAIEPFAGRFAIEQGRRDAFMDRAELLRRVAGARALVSWGADRIDGELLDAAPRLRIVANFGVGYDSVDVAAATARGIWVSNTPDVLTDATADLALLLILAVLRRAAEGSELVRHGGWSAIDPDALWGRDVRGTTVGILGFGRIGRAVAARAVALGMRVRYHGRHRLPHQEEQALRIEWAGFDELLGSVDVLSVHLPLTDETRGRIGAAELARMTPGSYLVNTARGAIIDEAALVAALDSGHLAGVGLDVFAREPAVPAALREHPRAFCLPHVGSATGATRGAMMRLCLENVADVLAGGAPRTAVNDVADRAGT